MQAVGQSLRSTGAMGVSVMMAGHFDQPVRPERRPASLPGDDRKRVERTYLRFAGVGVQFGLTIVLLTVFGIWLDGRLDTRPLFTVVLLLLSFVGGTWSLVRQVLGPDKKE